MCTSKRLLTVIILAISLISFLLIKDKYLLVDEGIHYRLIVKASAFHFSSEFLDIAELPGYAISIGTILHFLGISQSKTRLITTIFSLLSVLTFYFIAKKIDQKTSEIKTLQYFFFPILFIFFFLIYTDVYSLLFVLFTFLLILKKRYYWAGLIGFLSLLIRQNNLIWLGFFCTYIFLDKYKLQNIRIDNLTKYLKDIKIFIFSFIISIAFTLITKGGIISESARQIHALSFHLENIFFILFLFFFLFLPLNLANFSKIFQLFKNKPLFFVLPTLLLLDIYLLYILTFKVDSPMNGPSTYFLRNILLNYMIENPLNKSIFFIPIGYSILSLCVTPLINKKHYLIYPFTFIFLGLLWLVEQRYYLIPFTFFLLFKKSQSFLIEYSTLAIYIFLAEIIFFITISGKFFL